MNGNLNSGMAAANALKQQQYEAQLLGDMQQLDMVRKADRRSATSEAISWLEHASVLAKQLQEHLAQLEAERHMLSERIESATRLLAVVERTLQADAEVRSAGEVGKVLAEYPSGMSPSSMRGGR
jgi:hypothetical protein